MDYEILDSKTRAGGRVEILSYGVLGGSSDARTAERLFFLREARMRLKSVRINLNKGRCRIEPGALYHMAGKLSLKSSTAGGIMQAIGRSIMTGESMLLNEVEGSGEVILEPTFGHFFLVEISDGSALIVEKGMFFAALGDIDVSVIRNKGLGMVGGEGAFQTKLSGEGIAVLMSPVPMEEVVECAVTADRSLMVDGNFALMRTEGVQFSLNKSSRSLFSTAVSGEGMLQTFTGEGTVWYAPTQIVYDLLATPKGMETLSRPVGASSNKVG